MPRKTRADRQAEQVDAFRKLRLWTDDALDTRYTLLQVQTFRVKAGYLRARKDFNAALWPEYDLWLAWVEELISELRYREKVQCVTQLSHHNALTNLEMRHYTLFGEPKPLDKMRLLQAIYKAARAHGFTFVLSRTFRKACFTPDDLKAAGLTLLDFTQYA